ncbi:MAG: 2-oxo acid dehydrogenase subunit E2 [Gammaproteobacteria bacterium]|nr:2-oxo acid dehydrogenase subunit E2 [Gammaproteobacteria bacterium]
MKVFNLPDLGEGLTEAEIHAWHVSEGEDVKLDQVLVSMETAKAVVEVPSPQAGTIAKLYGKPGEVIFTGAPLVEFAGGEEVSPAATVAGKLQVGETILNESPTGIKVAKRIGVRAMPAARLLAAREGVDLSQIKGTGAANQITLHDVELALRKPPAEDMVPLKGVRKAMAQVMIHSHEEVVPVTLVDDADIQAWSPETDITLRIIRAIIFACAQEPALNAWFDGVALSKKSFSEVNLGIALDAADGLFVPVIKSVETYSTTALRSKIDLFKQQAQARTLPAEELQGATFTLSNFGVFAGRYASPIIVPPSVAILAVGKLRHEAVYVKEVFENHRMMPLSLTFDHRAATGGEAARFLRFLIEDLQKR